MRANLILKTLVLAAGLTAAGTGLVYAATPTTLDKIVQNGTIVVGTDASIRPLSFVDPTTGDVEGFVPDLVRLYAHKLGVKAKVMDIRWAGLFPALDTGKIDLVAANVTTTIPRTAKMDFIDPWLFTGASFLVKKDSSIQTQADLNSGSVTFGETKGSVYVDIVQKDFPKAKVLQFDTLADYTQALLTGRIDAVVDDSLVINLSALKGHESQLRVLPGTFMPQTYSFAVRIGDNSLSHSLDVFFRMIKLDGEYAAIYKKWMGSDWQPQTVGY